MPEHGTITATDAAPATTHTTIASEAEGIPRNLNEELVWAAQFAPRDGCDYEWIVQEAAKQYDMLDRCYDVLDARATSLLTLLASYFTALATASVAGLTMEAVKPVLVISALPSMIMAFWAISYGVWSKRTIAIPCPPSARELVRYVHHYHEHKFTNKSTTINAIVGPWHMAVEGMREAVLQKAQQVDCFIRLSVISVALLAAPLIAALAIRANK